MRGINCFLNRWQCKRYKTCAKLHRLHQFLFCCTPLKLLSDFDKQNILSFQILTLRILDWRMVLLKKEERLHRILETKMKIHKSQNYIFNRTTPKLPNGQFHA